LGRNETRFTEKVVEFRDEEWPENYAQEEYDENGMNILHYCIIKGYGEAVNELLDNLGFGNEQIMCVQFCPLVIYCLQPLMLFY